MSRRFVENHLVDRHLVDTETTLPMINSRLVDTSLFILCLCRPNLYRPNLRRPNLCRPNSCRSKDKKDSPFLLKWTSLSKTSAATWSPDYGKYKLASGRSSVEEQSPHNLKFKGLNPVNELAYTSKSYNSVSSLIKLDQHFLKMTKTVKIH